MTTDRPTREEIAALQERYQFFDLILIAPTLVSIAACATGWYFAISALARVAGGAVRSGGPAAHILLPSEALWALPGIFLGIVTAALPLDGFTRLWHGPRYAEYMRYSRYRYRIDALKAFAVLVVIVVLASAVAIALGLDCYTRFDDRGIAVNPLLGLGERRHAWSEVRAVRAVETFVAPSGRVVPRPYYAIHFAEGSRWTTRDGGRDPLDSDAEIVEFAAARAGCAIEVVERD